MKKRLIFILFFACCGNFVYSQCVVCKKTVSSSLDHKSAKGLNSGILYLAAMPLAMMGFIGYKWWKQNKNQD